MINVKAISINVGKALLVSAFFMFVSLLISIAEEYDSAFTPLLISLIITTIVGAFPFIFVRNAPLLSLRDGFLTIILAWLLSFVFGMLPYVLWGGEFTLVNAWFESVSGIPLPVVQFCRILRHCQRASFSGGLPPIISAVWESWSSF